MSNKTSGVNWNRSSKSRQRRKNVIDRLENQLESGFKTSYDKEDGCLSPIQIKLTDSDIKRINKEIETLKTRI